MAQIRAIYFSSFPKEEQRPWGSMLALNDNPNSNYNIIGIFDDKQALLGFLTLWDFDSFYYIEHFAIDQNCRNGGVGSQALTVISADFCANKPIVIEVELPDTSPMANRRIGFYSRNGFIAYPEYKYIQPPYGPELPAVPLMLMATGQITHSSLSIISSVLHSHVYGVKGRICRDDIV